MPEKLTDWRSAHTALFTVLLPISAFVPALQKWPLFWLAPLLAYAVIVAAFPRLLPVAKVLAFIVALNEHEASSKIHIKKKAECPAHPRNQEGA
jgi:hypothetical protein